MDKFLALVNLIVYAVIFFGGLYAIYRGEIDIHVNGKKVMIAIFIILYLPVMLGLNVLF